MGDRLQGKVVIVTGAASGQGAAEARLCREQGAEVVLTDVNADGQHVADECGGVFLRHDVAVADDWAAVVAATVERFGRIDGLVNNAGILAMGRLLETDEETYRRVIDVNQVGVFLGMRHVAPHMVEQGSGSIVNISSGAGIRASGGTFAYVASKFAVTGMTKAAALELGRFGVRVNSVHPGVIDTPMVAGGVSDKYARHIPLKRVAQPIEVATLVLYLLSDESSYSTGSEFVVDGGVTA